MINIRLSSIFVTDQNLAEKFYTEKIGFVIKNDVPLGEHRWLTVGVDGNDFEMLLEPNSHPAAAEFAKKIFDDGIPATTLFVDDIQKEYERLSKLDVKFTGEPVAAGAVKVAVFDDTCGNYVQLCQL